MIIWCQVLILTKQGTGALIFYSTNHGSAENLEHTVNNCYNKTYMTRDWENKLFQYIFLVSAL